MFRLLFDLKKANKVLDKYGVSKMRQGTVVHAEQSESHKKRKRDAREVNEISVKTSRH